MKKTIFFLTLAVFLILNTSFGGSLSGLGVKSGIDCSNYKPGSFDYMVIDCGYKNSVKIITPDWIIAGLDTRMQENPYSLDDYCNSLSDGMQPSCESAKESLKQTDAYKEAVEKYEKKQKEESDKQAELDAKQKELEEKQAEIEKKQRELEEKQSQILKSQENIVTTETVEKIVEEKVEKKMTEEISKAKKSLGDKAIIFESLVSLFKQKDQKTQDNVKALLKTFTQSKDEYTRNIGIYFGYLVE